MYTRIPENSIDVSLYVMLYDETNGSPKTGLVYSDTSLSIYYVHELTTPISISPAPLASITAAHSDGGFIEVDATNMPGLYRLDIPDGVAIAEWLSAKVYIMADEILNKVIDIDLVTNEVALKTSIADDDPDGSSTDQTFTLVDGPNSSPSDDSMYNFMAISVTDISGKVRATRRVIAYVASLRKVTVDYPFEFPLAIGDMVQIWASTYSTTAGVAAADEIADAVIAKLKLPYQWGGL
jgi:hypothetical protein